MSRWWEAEHNNLALACLSARLRVEEEYIGDEARTLGAMSIAGSSMAQPASSSRLAYASHGWEYICEFCRNLCRPKSADRSVTEYLGAGYGAVAEQGETLRESEEVVVVLFESTEGDRGVSKEKDPNMVLGMYSKRRDTKDSKDLPVCMWARQALYDRDRCQRVDRSCQVPMP